MKKECKDCDEQARLNGMGAEREARLMARMAEVEKERDELKALHDEVCKRVVPGECDSGDAYRDILTETRQERDALKAQLEQARAELKDYKSRCQGWADQCTKRDRYVHDLHAMLGWEPKHGDLIPRNVFADQALAQCAVLREALEEIVNVVDAGHSENGGILAANAAMASWARKALSSTSAGADILERVKRLEGVKEAAKEYCSGHKSPEHALGKLFELEKALAALAKGDGNAKS